MANQAARQRLPLEELIVFNNELLALVRSGQPLDEGLLELGGELSGRLGKAARQAGERLQQGQRLEEALDVGRGELAEIYKAVVAAGQQSGQLGAALEGLAVTARRTGDLKQQIRVAWAYPLLVLVAAYGLAVWTITRVLPEVYESYAVQRADASSPLIEVGSWAAGLPWWMWLLPPAAVAGMLLGLSHAPGIRWLPGPRQLARWSGLAVFSDVLALLVEQGQPLSESIELAAGVTGNRELTGEAARIAERLRRGETPTAENTRLLPPLVVWLCGGGAHGLTEPLRQAAESYHRRARRLARVWSTYMPVLLTIVIGGAATLAYALLVFWPWYSFMHSLSVPLVS